MNNVNDLNIENEILPLFDYSLNKFSKHKILELLNNPLSSIEEINYRHQILKGFAENDNILKDYSYTVLYLNEVYSFLINEDPKYFDKHKLKYKLFASKRDKTRYASKISLIILFFYRLENRYLSRLELDVFPNEYVSKIRELIRFLSNFQLSKFESIIREKSIKDNHVLFLTQTIKDLKDKKLIKAFWENFFQFEAYLSISKAISKHNYCYPTFENNGISLQEFYHPLLNNPVKNTLETNSNVIVLNGPNMSGKSTLLKAIGICMYVGHLGLGIPASRAKLPFVDCFSIEINRRDDITNGYSHFMTEIMNLKSIIQQANDGKNCLAIFDELFSGTNVEDAFKISKTTIKGLSKYKKSYFFISTHIQDLKDLNEKNIENYFIDCKLIENKPTFTYELKKGWSDIKVGRILFEIEGLNKLLED